MRTLTVQIHIVQESTIYSLPWQRILQGLCKLWLNVGSWDREMVLDDLAECRGIIRSLIEERSKESSQRRCDQMCAVKQRDEVTWGHTPKNGSSLMCKNTWKWIVPLELPEGTNPGGHFGACPQQQTSRPVFIKACSSNHWGHDHVSQQPWGINTWWKE